MWRAEIPARGKWDLARTVVLKPTPRGSMQGARCGACKSRKCRQHTTHMIHQIVTFTHVSNAGRRMLEQTRGT